MKNFRSSAADSIANAKAKLSTVEADFLDLCSYLLGNMKR
jgi:hypothetical protein